MKFLGIILPLTPLLLLVGCASVQSYDGVVRSPKSQIDVYEAGKEPNKPYKVIMEYSEKGDIGKEAHAHQAFLERAKALGADAIIMKPMMIGGVNRAAQVFFCKML